MTDNTTPELTDQQIELAQAFNLAVRLFVNNMREEYRTATNMGKFGDGQIISKIANIAAEEIAEITDKYGYSQHQILGIIRGAVQGSLIEVENAVGDNEQEEMLDFCKNQILRDLFLSTKGDLKFPKSLYVDGHPDFDTPNLSPAELKYF